MRQMVIKLFHRKGEKRYSFKAKRQHANRKGMGSWQRKDFNVVILSFFIRPEDSDVTILSSECFHSLSGRKIKC